MVGERERDRDGERVGEDRGRGGREVEDGRGGVLVGERKLK